MSSFTQLGPDFDGEAPGDLSGNGTGVSLSADGSIVAIGAPLNDGNGDKSGHVRIFQWNGTAWIQLGNDIDGEVAGEKTGANSLSSDGNVIAIGALRSDGGGTDAGHVRVFAWNGTAWVQRGENIEGEYATDVSGRTVSISSDGNTVARGAAGNSDNGNNAGQIRVFDWNGTAWVQRGNDIDGEAAGDWFGETMSLSGDGTTVAGGALFNDGNGTNSGHTRIYRWNGTAWSKLGSDIDGEAAHDHSGKCVSLSNDGNIVAIGAYYNDGNGEKSGHTRIFQWNGTAWSKLGSDIDGEALEDRSGQSISLSGDGTLIAIGAPSNDGNGNKSGHTRIYQWDSDDWVRVGSDIDGEAADDQSGWAVSLSSDGSTVAIGTKHNDGNGDDAGHVRVFKVRPTFSSAATSADGNKVVLTYDESLSSTTAATTAFTVRSGGAVNTVNSVAISGSTVELTVANVIKQGQAVHVSYADPTSSNDNNAVQNAGGTDAATLKSASVNNQSTVAANTSLGFSVQQIGSNELEGSAKHDQFGHSISISRDGTILAVGAIEVNQSKGYVEVYEQIGNSWQLLGNKIIGDTHKERFGGQISLSADGTRLVVGASRNHDAGNQAGTARIYELNTSRTEWIAISTELDGSNIKARAGEAVAISGDGNTVAVGMPQHRKKVSTNNPGNVAVYKYNALTEDWTLYEINTSGSPDGIDKSEKEHFGSSVALSYDGNTIIVGAPKFNNPASNYSSMVEEGRAVIYDFTEGVGYTKVDDIRGQAFHGALIGSSVAISDDGETVVVGGPHSKSNQNYEEKTGVTYVYERDNNNKYELIAKPIWGKNFEDRAGAVSISGDGKRVARAVRGHDEHKKSNIGRVEIYEYLGGKHWTLIGNQLGEDKGDNAGWGKTSIALSGDGSRVVLASKLNDNVAKNAGHVRVFDINNNGAAIVTESINVSESKSEGFVIRDLTDSNTGTDEDPDGDAITYSIIAGNTAGLFTIDSSDGKLSIASGQSLDYETATSHALTIEASDGVISTTATITINVTNVNDNDPDIANASANIAEDQAADTSFLDLNDSHTTNDNDRDGNAITYSITAGNDAGLFSIDDATGDLKIATGKALDYESTTSHVLTVEASDGENTDNATITVNVTNVNDNAPTIANASTSIDEDKPAGTDVININDSTTGNDTDADSNAITYSITAGNTDGIFSIVEAEGLIKIATGKSLDYDTASSHSLTILATDGTNTDTATIQVNVGNTDVNAPSIANDATPTIPENADANTTIVDINDSNTGNDTDNDGDALTYSIAAGNDAGLFSIDGASGVITIAAGKELDFESAATHILTVEATDGTNTDNATITVNVTNINDNEPAISNTSTTVPENKNANESFLNLNDSHTNNDSDRDGNAITYSITAGNDPGLFSINDATGDLEIATGKALDFESATSHVLSVQASDGTNTDNATITVNVDNINDNAPVVIDEVIQALETIDPGTGLTDLKDSNTDTDTDPDGDAITYSITSGNTGDIFTISKTTGEITVAAGKSLDFDHHDQHVLQISATDGTNTDTAQITINVLDSNTAPSAEDDSETLNENESLSRTAENGIIQSNDTDAEGDSLSISQFQTGESSNPSPVIGAFGVPLDGEYGQLTLQANGSFDYAANRIAANALTTGESVTDTFSYTLSDGKLADTAEIDITINGINDAPHLVDAIKTKKYTEKQGKITVIDGSLTIRDVDDTNIESATVAITGAFQTTEDTLAFADNFDITHTWDQATGILSLTGSTTKANYESALQTITYTNTDNVTPVLGLRTISWSINDGEADSTAVTSQIDVGGVNDSPEAFNEAVSLNAGSTVSTPDKNLLLDNDQDPEDDLDPGKNLTISLFRFGTEQTSNPDFNTGETITGTYGQLTVEADGNYNYEANQLAAQRLLTGETRTEAFNYTIVDTDNAEDTGEIIFSITGVNDKPTASNDIKQINENANKFFNTVQGLLINDTDLDGDPIEVTNIRTGLETSNFLGISAIGSSIQGTYGHLTLESDGSYRYNANLSNADALDAGDVETDIFTYTLSDSQLEDNAEIRVQVKGVNDAPTLSAITAGAIADLENSTNLTSSHLSGQLTANDLDASAVLSYGVNSVSTAGNLRNSFNTSSTSSTAGTYGQLSINSSTGDYTYTPNSSAINNLNANQTATETFTIFVSDGSETATRNFDIQITGAADAPSSSNSGSSSSGSSSSGSSSSGSSDSSTESSSSDNSSDSSTTNDAYLDTLIGSLINEQTSTTNQFSNFLTSADSFLVASNDLSMLKFQSSETEFFYTEEGGGGAGRMQWDQLSSFDLNNGIRIMLPDFCMTAWDDPIPDQRAGEIPLFISLLKQPDQDATIQLQAETLQATLSTNILHFTPENWDQPQIVWAKLNDRISGESISNLDIEASLQIGNKPAEMQTEIFSISLPENHQLALGGCARESDNTSQSDSENPNIDLELSTVREEESPTFLLLRTALSPLILLTNMAMHSIQQIKGAPANKLNNAQNDNQRSNESSLTTALPQESNQIDFSFKGIELTPPKISPDASWESFSSLPIAPTISSLDADQQHSIHDLW